MKFYNSVIINKPFCLNKLPAYEKDINIESGKEIRLPCVHRCPESLLDGIKWTKHTSKERYHILTHILRKRFQKIIYNKQHIDKINQDNILIDSTVSNIDLVLKIVKATDEGDYICEPKCRDSTLEETSIVSLHVKGKSLYGNGSRD